MKRILIGLLLSLSFNAFADSSVGCGLGSLIWKKNSILSALFRLTTNHSFSTQLFGITTGTSGCSQHSIVKNEMAPVYYAEANLNELKLDMSRGNGEFLSTFALTLGCDESATSMIAPLSQASYQEIFRSGQETPSEMLSNFKQVLSKNERTKNRCKYAVI